MGLTNESCSCQCVSFDVPQHISPSCNSREIVIAMPANSKKTVRNKERLGKDSIRNDLQGNMDDPRATKVLNLLNQLNNEVDEDLAEVELFNTIQFVVILGVMVIICYFASSFLSIFVLALLLVFGLITIFIRPSPAQLPGTKPGTTSN